MALPMLRNHTDIDEAYETRRLAHVKEMRSRAPEHLERLSWSPERLKAERESRLRALIRFACAQSSFHRERLGHLKVDQLGERNLSSIPVMTRQDLMENFDEVLTDKSVTLDLIETHFARLTTDAYLNDRFHAVASGGSSGLRGVFVYGWESWTDAFLSILRYSIRAQLQSPAPPARPVRMAAVAAHHATHMSSSLPQTFNDIGTMSVVRIPVTLPLPTIVDKLNEANPDVLTTYPSVLPELAHEARR
jgi:phenylacetate-CoA ligase